MPFLVKNEFFFDDICYKTYKKIWSYKKKSSIFAADLKNDKSTLQNDHFGNDPIIGEMTKWQLMKTNLFCTLNKQTNTLEKQAS